MYKPIGPHKLTEALEDVRQGGTLYVPTYGRVTVIDTKALAKFEKTGQWLLKEDGGPDGDLYRLRTGRTSVTLLPGQLKYNA